ncbi:hypothetical protein L249_7704 [Ophiocordyceps polyrhachis-furcata BCC 54312]|uniref:Uncharacterized protein n=1 Tax=Ophiocordyceps polyrhachis-furcata BCC 54312 TaxID=1330021 RepID=A0A367LA17_9HYPO|nr:hypothetical protein L249_7704 [Ophiocordyceps polyrhachis-furcata BCC 54312]
MKVFLFVAALAGVTLADPFLPDNAKARYRVRIRIPDWTDDMSKTKVNRIVTEDDSDMMCMYIGGITCFSDLTYPAIAWLNAIDGVEPVYITKKDDKRTCSLGGR